MFTKEEREEAFRKDLKELLEKHKAELWVGDDGRPYGLHSGVVEITMYGKWDENGDQIAEFTDFKL